MTSISDQKAKARKDARARRKAAQSETASAKLITHFPPQEASQIIGGVWPLKNEIDPRPLMSALAAQGHELALPCTPEVGQPLTFRAYAPGDPLIEGPYDTREPRPDQPELFPTFVLVPMLAFTMDGKRLGYGGGFYDRTLSGLKARHAVFACGVAFAAQEAADLPTDIYDQRLDGILTEDYFKAF